MNVYRLGDELYVETVGPLTVLNERGDVGTAWQLPGSAVELLDEDESVHELLAGVRTVLEGVKMSAAARRAVAAALDEMDPYS